MILSCFFLYKKNCKFISDQINQSGMLSLSISLSSQYFPFLEPLWELLSSLFLSFFSSDLLIPSLFPPKVISPSRAIAFYMSSSVKHFMNANGFFPYLLFTSKFTNLMPFLLKALCSSYPSAPSGKPPM